MTVFPPSSRAYGYVPPAPSFHCLTSLASELSTASVAMVSILRLFPQPMCFISIPFSLAFPSAKPKAGPWTLHVLPSRPCLCLRFLPSQRDSGFVPSRVSTSAFESDLWIPSLLVLLVATARSGSPETPIVGFWDISGTLFKICIFVP